MLLQAARTEGVKGLKTEAARVEASASTDQDERYRRAIGRRFLRHRRLSDVEGMIEMRGPIDRTARVMAALEPIEHAVFEEARVGGGRWSFPRRWRSTRCCGSPTTRRGSTELSDGRRSPATVVVRVDRSAFGRGGTVEGEVCEIVGCRAGPGEGRAGARDRRDHEGIITDGTDVRAVSHLGRAIPARLRTALEEMQPECVIAGCHVDRHLEIDHDQPFAAGGPTELGNLNRLCHHHHDLKTRNRPAAGRRRAWRKRLIPADRAPPG